MNAASHAPRREPTCLGDDRLNPGLFRFGAITLVNDLLTQIAKQADGDDPGSDYFSLP